MVSNTAGTKFTEPGDHFFVHPVYSLKLKQRLLQEAAARRTHKAASASAASSAAESNFTKIVNKVERIRLQDESTDDVNEEDDRDEIQHCCTITNR